MNEGLDLPYSFDRVWDAAISVLQQAKWNVTKADKATGSIEMHVVMDMITWTETFFANLTRNNDDSTRVIMGRIGLAQPVDWGSISPVYRVIPQQAGKRSKERRLEFEDSLGRQPELTRRSAVPSQSRFYQPTTISSFANAICHKQSETYS